MIHETENITNARARTARETEQEIRRTDELMAEVLYGPTNSHGDAGLGGSVDEEGVLTGWFCIGDGVGTNPVRPALRP